MRKVIYTVVTGGYDTVRSKPVKGYDMIILTDDKYLKVEGWETISFEPWSDPIKLSRHLKILAHRFIEADVYYYIDANYEIIGDFPEFNGGYVAFNHPARRCIYQEASKVIQLYKLETVRPQVSKYAQAGYPSGNGLYANGFFIRDRSADGLCELWWNEVNQHSNRDQISLPYVAWNSNIFDSMDLPNGVLRLRPHKKYKKESPNVYYFSPNRGDKMLGEWYNKHCEIVPNDSDWICITDHDAMFLHPYSAKLIEDAIKEYGEEYLLFSCYTNRLGLTHQLPFGMDDGWGMERNMELSRQLYDEYYCEVEESKAPTAGFFMLFQKKTWKENKFQNGIISKDGSFIDWKFSNAIFKKGKIGIIKGLYMYHLYRMWGKTSNIDHLK